MTADPATIAWYTANAARYDPRSDLGPSRRLLEFLDRLAPGARILELGCGAGRDSAEIAGRGFDLDPTDGTPAMVARTRESTGLAARVLHFDKLAVDAGYDAVWAHACLLHVPVADLSSVLARINRALRPGGLHFANYKLGCGEGRDPLGRLTNFPSAPWLEGQYRAAGFSIVAREIYRGEGADGVQRDWLALTIQRPR